MSHMLS